MWAGCFASCECSLIYLRQKDDPINAIIGGVFTGGLLAIRGRCSLRGRRVEHRAQKRDIWWTDLGDH